MTYTFSCGDSLDKGSSNIVCFISGLRAWAQYPSTKAWNTFIIFSISEDVHVWTNWQLISSIHGSQLNWIKQFLCHCTVINLTIEWVQLSHHSVPCLGWHYSDNVLRLCLLQSWCCFWLTLYSSTIIFLKAINFNGLFNCTEQFLNCCWRSASWSVCWFVIGVYEKVTFISSQTCQFIKKKKLN